MISLRRKTIPTVKYLIDLTDGERKRLPDIVSSGKAAARTILRANILLAFDRNVKNMTAQQATERYHTTATTIQNIRALFCELEIATVLNRKKGENSTSSSKDDR